MTTDTSPDNKYLNSNADVDIRSPVNTSKVNILKKRIKLIKPLPFIEETLSQNRLTNGIASVSSLNRFRISKPIHICTLHNTENVDPLTPADKPESSITVKTSELIRDANDEVNSIINVHSRPGPPYIRWKRALERTSTRKKIRDNIDMESFAKFAQKSQDNIKEINSAINYLNSTVNETNSLTKCDNILKAIEDTRNLPFFNMPNLYRLCIGISKQFDLQAPTVEFAEFIMRIAEEFCRNLVEDIILSAHLRNKIINDELFTEDSNLKRQIRYLNSIKRCRLEESTREHKYSEQSDESEGCEAGEESEDSEDKDDSELTEIELRQLEDLNKAALEAIGNRRHKANNSNIDQLTRMKKLKPKLTIGMKDIIRSLENRHFPNKAVIMQYGYEGMFDKFKPSP